MNKSQQAEFNTDKDGLAVAAEIAIFNEKLVDEYDELKEKLVTAGDELKASMEKHLDILAEKVKYLKAEEKRIKAENLSKIEKDLKESRDNLLSSINNSKK